jgi:Uma2 family endonuclease
MASQATARRYQPEDLLTMEDGDRYELVDGELVERDVSFVSSEVGLNIGPEIRSWNRGARMGRVCGADLLLRIFPWDPAMTRAADASFISNERAPRSDQGLLEVAPELVVEVVSPNDAMSKVRDKVDLWLTAGVSMVWLALPGSREIHVYRSDAKPRILVAEDILSGEDVLPGFAVPVGSLFPDAVAATP